MKQFEIEERKNPTGNNGRPTVSFGKTGRFLFGCLSAADPDQRMEWQQMSETITHSIVQAGIPQAKKGDRLRLDGRIFEIKGVEDFNSLGISTIYYAEEKAV